MTLILSGTNGITSVNGTAAAPSVTGTDTDTGIVYGTNTITLATNGTAGLVQDASQNVGIGTGSPASPLQINSATAPTSGSILRIDNTATTTYSSTGYVGGQIRLNYTNATNRYGGINFSNTGATSQEFFGTVQNSSGYGDFVWQGYGSAGYLERLRLNSGGTVILQGGSTSATGIGITFPATQSASTNANTLDDYEEGEFTPVYTSGVTSPVYTDAFGYYTKIGRFVQITIRMQLTSGTATSSQVAIGGLPFTASASGGSQGAFTLGYQNAFESAGFTMLGRTSSTAIDFYQADGTPLNGNEVDSLIATLHITGIYMV